MNEFTQQVITEILAIPRGRVATYKQIATLAGRPHASRAVSWILNSCTKKYKLPWQRVINSKGKIAFKPKTRNFLRQRSLLREEGVKVDPVDGEIDLKRFQYRKKPQARRKKRNLPTMFD